MWRLRARLRVVVLGVPLALSGCRKKDRDPPPPAASVDAAVVVRPAPATVDAAAEPPADAELAVAPDAALAVRPGKGGKQTPAILRLGKPGEKGVSRDPPTFQDTVTRGRALHERGIARVAPVRGGRAWSS